LNFLIHLIYLLVILLRAKSCPSNHREVSLFQIGMKNGLENEL
jgi:hypothetical protein